jgi:hypothetical protein
MDDPSVIRGFVTQEARRKRGHVEITRRSIKPDFKKFDNAYYITLSLAVSQQIFFSNVTNT